MSTTPFWKKINQTVSGHSQNITEDIVTEILNLSKTELVEGLLSYKPYTKKSYEEWSKTTNITSGMKEFVHELSVDLKLDTEVTYLVMCNYLMFEYYGKIKEFWQITRIGTTGRLKESIWNFYTAERMFLLKTLRHILECVQDTKADFSKQYKGFLDSIKVNELQSNLIKQFENLCNEITEQTYDDSDKYLENWLCRKNREQTELIMILILTTNHSKLTTDQFGQIVKLFCQDNFYTQPVFYEITKFSNQQDLLELMSAEVACFFVLINNLWDANLSEFWKSAVINDIEKSLLSIHSESKHMIIPLAWLMLKSKSSSLEGDETRIFEIFQTQPFLLLHFIISNQIFNNCKVGETVLKAVHKMIDELCLMYDDRKSLYEQEGLIQLTAKFMTLPELTEICLKTRNGLDRIVEIAIETFPYDFFSFSLICKSLLGQEGQYKNTIQLLHNVPSFLSEMTWPTPKEEIYVSKQSQPAFPDSDLVVFPANTTVCSYAIFDRNLVQYKGTYNYFFYLEYLVNLLIETGIRQHKFSEDLVKKVVAGYAVVSQGIKHCLDMDLKVVGLERIVQKLDKLLQHLDGPLLEFDLVKLYFDVQNAMMVHRNTNIFDSCPEIVWKIFFPKLKHEFLSQSSETLLFNQYIFEDTIFIKLFKEEDYHDDHVLLLTYIEILYNSMKVKFQFKTFQLSGVAYLFNFVFLQHQSWDYNDEHQKTKITLALLKIFHYILQRNPDELTNSEQQIFYLCQHAFLNNAFIIESFLRLFIKEKYHLIFLMERESNWLKGPTLDKLQCIRMQLALLLLIMKQKKAMKKKCVFDDKLSHVVKPIASYFTNSYSPIIAELSCRFLEKLAQDKYIPLLALLELDHYQVQALFLERLRDPLEEENVKLAIIDLINTCIANQNGMTAAFFNLKCFMYWDGSNKEDSIGGDTVSDFMVDYLQNIKKSHEYFKNPLQLGILRLLYNLWVTHRENLIDNIATLKDFWPVMIDPFFCDFEQEVEVYTVILRIINLEVNSNIDEVQDKLIETIEKFFKNKNQFQKWTEFLVKETNDPSKDNIELLNAWMEFLVLTKKVAPKCFDDDVKASIVICCLDGLNCTLTGVSNIEIVYLWCQLYLMLVSSWSVYEDNEKFIIEKLTKFLCSLSTYYKYLSPKIKEVVLCIVNKTLIDLHKYFGIYTTTIIPFLKPLGEIVDMEHEFLLTAVWNAESEAEKALLLKSWIIIIFIGNSLLALYNLYEIALWFTYREFLKRVMNSVAPMLQTKSTITFAKIAIDFMITYASSPLASDFLEVDLFNFYYKIRPPHLTITVGEAIMSGLPYTLREWWLIIFSLVRLNRMLLEYLHGSVVDACFSFVLQHDQTLKEVVCLTKYTVDMTALSLVCETLKLLDTIHSLKPRWIFEYTQSHNIITDGVKTSINGSVLSILGSKKINFYNIVHSKDLDVISNPSPDLLVSVLNKLVEIIYWSCNFLRRSKPDLIRLLEVSDPVEFLPLIVEHDFSVPRFELPTSPNLTYGMLLCLAHYLCKTLNQLSPQTPSVPPKTRQVSLTELDDVIKVKSLGTIFEHCTANYEQCTGFMVFLQRSDDLPNEKLTSFLHYDMSEFSNSSSTALASLDYNLVKNALEVLMTFLACEIFATIKNLRGEYLFAYKRELGSEIQFYYEFVRKRTSEMYNSMKSSNQISFLQNETDIIKRYMIAKKSNVSDVVDNNFFLVISQWLVKFCELSN